eukprot:14920364-Ditylum_brightwellii.AAC.1
MLLDEIERENPGSDNSSTSGDENMPLLLNQHYSSLDDTPSSLSPSTTTSVNEKNTAPVLEEIKQQHQESIDEQHSLQRQEYKTSPEVCTVMPREEQQYNVQQQQYQVHQQEGDQLRGTTTGQPDPIIMTILHQNQTQIQQMVQLFNTTLTAMKQSQNQQNTPQQNS